MKIVQKVKRSFRQVKQFIARIRRDGSKRKSTEEVLASLRREVLATNRALRALANEIAKERHQKLWHGEWYAVCKMGHSVPLSPILDGNAQSDPKDQNISYTEKFIRCPICGESKSLVKLKWEFNKMLTKVKLTDAHESNSA